MGEENVFSFYSYNNFLFLFLSSYFWGATDVIISLVGTTFS